MKNWFATFFAGTSPPPDSIPAPKVSNAAPTPVVSWQPPIGIDGPWYQWLIAPDAPHQRAALDTERRLLDALTAVLASDLQGSRLIPRMPVVIPQLLRYLRDDTVSPARLSEELARDSLVLAEVIRQANNARFEGQDPIASVEQAVMLIGETGLRQLIATVTLQPIINLQSGHFTKTGAARIWAQSQHCALLCRSLAAQHAADPFEAYLAGLLHNIGMITALRVMDKAHDGMTAPLSHGFCNAYANAARRLSMRIGAMWELPPPLLQAFGEQVPSKTGIARSPLGEVLYIADQLGKARVLANHGRIADEPEPLTRRLDRDTAIQYLRMRARPQ